jgi:hypothetical protein
MNYDSKVTEYIENAPAAQKGNLEAIRELIHESVSDVSEQLKWGFPVFRKTKDFAYLRVAKNHTTLGFYNFDRINDAENLLEGEGNTLRHIKISAIDDMIKEQLAEWLAAVAGG